MLTTSWTSRTIDNESIQTRSRYVTSAATQFA